MELIFTETEKARLEPLTKFDYSETCTGVADGYLKIEFSSIGPSAVYVSSNGKRTIINVEDMDNA